MSYKPNTAAGKDDTHEEQGKLKRELNAFDLTVHTKKEIQTDRRTGGSGPPVGDSFLGPKR